MRVGIIVGFLNQTRKGEPHRGVLQPGVGPLIAGLLPDDVDIHVLNDTWDDPDWSRQYDLLFLSGLHTDFDRVRQISHYWRIRGAKTVLGGILPSTYPELCEPFFDAIVIGDPESTVPRIFDDFVAGRLQQVYLSEPYDPERVPVPRFDLLAKKQIVPLSMEATRGCPFTCEFCALTSLGTRFHARDPQLIVRDIREGQRMLRGLIPPWKMNWVVFNDNNIGGNPQWLREFCHALEPLKLKWGSAVTFNVVTNRDTIKALSDSGCRYLFMGLESFNRESLVDMHKVQNTIEKTRQVMDDCREHGIMVASGLMLNPLVDDEEYVRSIPRQLRECGLHVPSFISFEAPIPGTPHFHRLAAMDEPPILPNAYLRDFSGYTLVTRPRHETIEKFVQLYRDLQVAVGSARVRIRRLLDDIPRYLRGGHWMTVAVVIADMIEADWKPHPLRTFVAGTDREPPETRTIPLSASDFKSVQEQRAVMDPWLVTDSTGHVLPQWMRSQRVFNPRGGVAIEPVAAAAGH